jgi:THUMP domain-like/Conserved hypothetical protein 95
MVQKFIELLRPDVQHFIRVHENEDERAFALKYREVLGLPSGWIAEQLAGRRKSKEKLPTLYETLSILYPPSINLQQSSSECTAEFKANLLKSVLSANSAKITGADLTGGMGIDSLFLSRFCEHLDFVETEASLLEIAHHNHQVLGATHIQYHHSKAEAFLKTTTQIFNFIFIDPSRRNGSKKVFRLADCEPAITSILQLVFEKTSWLLLKASPLLDLQKGLNELLYVYRIIVVSVENECKEILFLCQKGSLSEPMVHCTNLLPKSRAAEEFIFNFSAEEKAKSIFSDPLSYLYEPNASLLKGGAFKLIGQKFGIAKLHRHTHLYTSENLIPDFPGRIFKIEERKPDQRNIQEYLPENKANVVTRNYPLSPDQLKRKLKIKDGGEKYLIGFSGMKAKFLMVAARVH